MLSPSVKIYTADSVDSVYSIYSVVMFKFETIDRSCRSSWIDGWRVASLCNRKQADEGG